MWLRYSDWDMKCMGKKSLNKEDISNDRNGRNTTIPPLTPLPPPLPTRWVLPNLVLKSHFSFAGCGRSGYEIRHLVTRPKRVCAAEKGMVFRVLNLKQGIQFHSLASWTGCCFETEDLKEVWRFDDEWSKCVVPTICVQMRGKINLEHK